MSCKFTCTVSQDSALQNISLNTIHLVILQGLHDIQDVDQHHILLENPNIFKRKYKHGILCTYLCRRAFRQFPSRETSEPKDFKESALLRRNTLARFADVWNMKKAIRYLWTAHCSHKKVQLSN
jgi:hypothetical protein